MYFDWTNQNAIIVLFADSTEVQLESIQRLLYNGRIVFSNPAVVTCHSKLCCSIHVDIDIIDIKCILKVDLCQDNSSF